MTEKLPLHRMRSCARPRSAPNGGEVMPQAEFARLVLGQAAAEALASCTVTLGAAKRISAALPLGIDSGGLEEAGIIT